MGVSVDVNHLQEIVTGLQNVQKQLSAIYTILGNSYIALSGNNTFTGTNTFSLPPIINAGAVGTGTFKPEGLLNIQASATGVGNGADATDDTLYTYALPSNSLDAVGRVLRIIAWGKLAANGNNKTVKLWFGASISYSTGVITSNNVGWRIQLEVVKTASGAQLASGFGQYDGTDMAIPLPLVGTETDTAPITIKATGASPTTHAANDVVANFFSVEYLN